MLGVWAPLWMMMRFIRGPCLCSQRNTELAWRLICWFVFQNQSKETDSLDRNSLDQLKVDFVSQVGSSSRDLHPALPGRTALEGWNRKCVAKKKPAKRDSKLTVLIWNEHRAPASRFPLAFASWSSMCSVVRGYHGWPTSSRPDLTLVNSHLASALASGRMIFKCFSYIH